MPPKAAAPPQPDYQSELVAEQEAHSTTKSEVKDLKSKLKKKEDDHQEATETIESKDKEIEKLNKEIEKSKKKEKELKREIEDLKQSHKEEVDKLEEEKEDLEGKLDRSEKKCEGLEGEVRILEGVKKDLEEVRDELTRKLNEVNQGIVESLESFRRKKNILEGLEHTKRTTYVANINKDMLNGKGSKDSPSTANNTLINSSNSNTNSNGNNNTANSPTSQLPTLLAPLPTENGAEVDKEITNPINPDSRLQNLTEMGDLMHEIITNLQKVLKTEKHRHLHTQEMLKEKEQRIWNSEEKPLHMMIYQGALTARPKADYLRDEIQAQCMLRKLQEERDTQIREFRIENPRFDERAILGGSNQYKQNCDSAGWINNYHSDGVVNRIENPSLGNLKGTTKGERVYHNPPVVSDTHLLTGNAVQGAEEVIMKNQNTSNLSNYNHYSNTTSTQNQNNYNSSSSIYPNPNTTTRLNKQDLRLAAEASYQEQRRLLKDPTLKQKNNSSFLANLLCGLTSAEDIRKERERIEREEVMT